MKTKKMFLCGILAGILSVFGAAMPMMTIAEEKVEETSSTEPSEVLEVDSMLVDFGFASELGRSYSGKFSVKNKGTEKIVVKFTTEEYAGIAADASKAGKDWLSYVGGKNVYEIEPESSADVALRFNIPTDAEKGRTQYATIHAVVTSEYGKDQSRDVVVKITTTDEKMEFGGAIENKLDSFKLNNMVSGAAIIKNSGKIGFESKVSVRVSPAFGLEDWKDIVPEQSIDVAPGNENLYVDFNEEMPYGIYKVEQKISYVNSEGKIITATNTGRVMLCPLWIVIVLAVVIVAIIVVVVIVKIKKRGAKE